MTTSADDAVGTSNVAIARITIARDRRHPDRGWQSAHERSLVDRSEVRKRGTEERLPSTATRMSVS